MKHSSDRLPGAAPHPVVMRGSSREVADTTPPVLASPPPYYIAPNASLLFTFSEPIKLGSGTVVLIANGQRSSYDIAASPGMRVDGSTLTFDPPTDLAANTEYQVWITTGAILDLSGNPLVHPNVGGYEYALTETFRTDIATAPVNTTGTADNDTIHGSNVADRIAGGGGRDGLYGHDGDDIIDGGDEPPDTSGNVLNRWGDTILGGAGNDVIHGNGGQDNLNGGAGDDRLYGDADGDWLFGGAGNDLLDGGDGADELEGGDGEDLLTGGAGNDTLNGGNGTDLARYTGNRSDYAFLRSQNGFTLTDLRGAAGDGRDTLVDVERVAFANAHVAFDTDGVAGQAFRLYRAAFDRAPDLGGIGFYIAMMDKGVSLLDVASSFVASDEFQSLYGSAPTTEELVTRMYTNVLHRAPDPTGYAFWVDVLSSQRASVAEVLAAFSEGPENQEATATLVAQGIAYTPYG